MKKSSKCPQCGAYATVDCASLPGFAVMDCACGTVVTQRVCPDCHGTGWHGLAPCACDSGLCHNQSLAHSLAHRDPQLPSTLTFGVKSRTTRYDYGAKDQDR